jgi:hypothetical protein
MASHKRPELPQAPVRQCSESSDFQTAAPNQDGRSWDRLARRRSARDEAWIGERFRSLGYEVHLTAVQVDHGADLVLSRPGETVTVQCKHRPYGSVGEPVLRDLFGAMHLFGADRAILVTTGELSAAAHTWLAGKAIEVLDARGLKEQWPDEIAQLTEQSAAANRAPLGATPGRVGRRTAWYAYTDNTGKRWAVELPRSIGDQSALGFEPITDSSIEPLPRTLRMRSLSLKSQEDKPRYLKRIPYGLPHMPPSAWTAGLVFVSSTGQLTTWKVRTESSELRDRGPQTQMPNGWRPPRWEPNFPTTPQFSPRDQAALVCIQPACNRIRTGRARPRPLAQGECVSSLGRAASVRPGLSSGHRLRRA